jgi:hypothetical protein
MHRMRLLTTVLLLTAASTLTVTGCVPGKQRNRNVPAGRGAFTQAIEMPKTDTKAYLAKQYGFTTAPAASPTPTQPTVTVAPSALPPALLNRKVTVHLTQGAPALASGPRKDVIKGTIRGMDGDFLVVDTEGGGTLYLPRATVLAIEELP